MAKATVQSMIHERLTRIEDKLDVIIPEIAGLKVKAAIAGGIAGILGTGIVTAILAAFKWHG